METLTTFLGLISRTQGRDKVLRLFQYACLHAVDHKQKGARFKVYEQMRMTRKLLRFLRTLDFLAKIKIEIPQLSKTFNFLPMFFQHLTNILQNLFSFLYFIADHKVCLTELNVLTKSQNFQQTYEYSYKFYLIQNIFGILNNLCCMIASIVKSSQQENKDKSLRKMIKAIEHYTFDLIRCCLDCVIAIYYWKKSISAKAAGIVGTISTIMGIMSYLERI